MPSEVRDAQKQSLALDALSKLAQQFADKPQFNRLIEVLVLTLSGQFSAPNVFASLQRPGSRTSERLYIGTGRFKNHAMLASLELSHQHRDYFVEKNAPLPVEQLDLADRSSQLAFVLCDCEVSVVVPLVHEKRLIGVVGIGERVMKRPFSGPDMELMATLVHSVAPFIANSFLFEEIAELNRWHLEILNSVRQGVFVFDEEDLLMTINHAGYGLLKRFKPRLPAAGSLIHVPLNWIFPPTYFPDWSEHFSRAGHNRGASPLKNLVARFEGEEFIFSARVSQLAGTHNSAPGFVVTLVDVTEQHNNERRMFDLERFADKGVMASSIAHELNNHLAMLLGGAELAEIRLGKGEIETAAATLTKLKDNVGKMQRFTAGLMDYGRLETSKARGDLNKVITDVLSFVLVQRRFLGVSIRSELDPALPEFEFDSDQISQLLLNLLNNAADAIRERGDTAGEIRVETFREDDSVVLVIVDNGCGIKDDVREKLFRQHLTTKQNGHGYGLVTCSKIINNHEASVTIRSAENEGAEFRFAFPLTLCPVAAQ